MFGHHVINKKKCLNLLLKCVKPYSVCGRISIFTMLIDSHFFCVQVNPPYYVRLVELVPHPETAAGVMSSTQAVMTKVQESCNNKEQRHVQ